MCINIYTVHLLMAHISFHYFSDVQSVHSSPFSLAHTTAQRLEILPVRKSLIPRYQSKSAKSESHYFHFQKNRVRMGKESKMKLCMQSKTEEKRGVEKKIASVAKLKKKNYRRKGMLSGR